LIHYLTELVSSADRFQLRYHEKYLLLRWHYPRSRPSRCWCWR